MQRIAHFAYGALSYLLFFGTFLYTTGFLTNRFVPKSIDSGETGSLENRFVGSTLRGKVHAKTGWIRGASSLSGYVQGEDGEQYVFSILIAYDRTKGGMNKHFKRIQEDMVEAIAAGRT